MSVDLGDMWTHADVVTARGAAQYFDICSLRECLCRHERAQCEAGAEWPAY
jgi:hypothetical protein